MKPSNFSEGIFAGRGSTLVWVTWVGKAEPASDWPGSAGWAEPGLDRPGATRHFRFFLSSLLSFSRSGVDYFEHFNTWKNELC